MMVRLQYGNTNTYYIEGTNGGLLIDTDYAGTLSSFYKAIKTNSIQIKDIRYVIATHYHPDHIGLISELMKQGIQLLLLESQIESVHFSDEIFFKENRLYYEPIDETKAIILRFDESREFLSRIGIAGEILPTPSHSIDSISIILDDGTCIVGDLEPMEYVSAYYENPALKEDWEHILSFNSKKICYAHANEKNL